MAGLFSIFRRAVDRGPIKTRRLDYTASCRKLHRLGLTDSDVLPLPAHRPRYDDQEPLGVNFFKTELKADLSGLTLPRTFIGRSEINTTSFRNTDLHESTFCWNDFLDVSFNGANLSGVDLRASHFEHVFFHDCDLSLADLRQSDFVGCSFNGASMKGAVLTYGQKGSLSLSDNQISEISWTDDSGDEPGGG